MEGNDIVNFTIADRLAGNEPVRAALKKIEDACATPDHSRNSTLS